MAFEKQLRNLYGYDIWMDWEKPRLGTTIAVCEGADNVQILYWADPSEMTKEEVLEETKVLYPDREVVLHENIDAHQAMVPRIVQNDGGIVNEPSMSVRSYDRRELVVIGGGLYYSYKGNRNRQHDIEKGDVFKVIDMAPILHDLDNDSMMPRKIEEPYTGRTRDGKPLKHWQR